MNKRDIDRCQHEKLDIISWSDNDDLIRISDADGNITLIVNVCKKCKLVYAEVPDESRTRS